MPQYFHDRVRSTKSNVANYFKYSATWKSFKTLAGRVTTQLPTTPKTVLGKWQDQATKQNRVKSKIRTFKRHIQINWLERNIQERNYRHPFKMFSMLTYFHDNISFQVYTYEKL